MINNIKKLLLIIFVAACSNVSAQGIFIASNENINIINGQMSIFSDVVNNGNFSTAGGTIVNFNGSTWQNGLTANFPLLNNGGVFVFDNNNAFGSGYLKQQIINGGFNVATKSGPGFPSLKINNMAGVKSIGFTDVQIKKQLDFANGKYFANGNNIYVGDASTGVGSITNYTDKKYIVLDNTLNGAFLYLAALAPNFVAMFPIGADSINYTPACILHKGATQEFKARAFNAVFDKAVSGNWGNPNFVQTTWNIGKAIVDTSLVTILLQHPASLEGNVFASNRDNSFVTRYKSQYQKWDTVPVITSLSNNTITKATSGTLTTGQIVPNTFVNTRIFTTNLGANEYFSKTTELASIGLTKNLDSVTKQVDGSFNLNFTFLVKNTGSSLLNTVLVSDNLQSVFPAGVEIKKLKLTATGNLKVNTNYTGLGADTSFLLNTSSLVPGKVDTITLLVNADFHKISGTFYNTAIANGTINAGSSNANSMIVSSLNGLSFTNNQSSTPIVIPAATNGVFIPGGFSPNRDGINDLFVLGNTINYNIKLEVYNRWGNKVYESKGFYQNNWDGSNNQNNSFVNEEIVDGTYYYIIQVYDKETGALIEKPIGFITIKRD
jgi:gliding motility-associated-like protein